MKTLLTEKDRIQLKRLNIREEDIEWQINMFKKGTPYVQLVRPCTVGDGIVKLSEKEANDFAELYEKKAADLKKIKFVPASGAATRMFKALSRFYNDWKGMEEVKRLCASGDQDAKDFITFWDNITRFAFYDDLKQILKQNGYEIDKLIQQEDAKKVLHFLLKEDGLNYANLPKALIKFHRYPDGARTAFEEHLVEAEGYISDKNGCYLHFTVSPEHRERFTLFFEQIKSKYEGKYCVKYNVEFSVQDHSTDTIAVDMDNKPFRLKDGTLLFRPGGHGALLENLNSIDADLIFIKNIDNVVPDRLKPPIYFWKKVLGGYLLYLKHQIDSFINLLQQKIEDQVIEEAAEFCKKYLYKEVPTRLNLSEKKDYILHCLNRPVRVCGMVKNVKEPGGGPFWVKDSEGNISLQIVESAQIDMSSEEQRRIFNSSTHFNPVDIVCSIKDWQGRKFDLKKYRDKNAVFITQKSKDGKELKALELPGLWNGGMAYWNTVFIEVPFVTFNPVKKVVDLLKENHQ